MNLRKITGFLYLDRAAATGADAQVDLWAGGTRVLRLTRRRAAKVYGPVTVLFAHKNGISVLKTEFEELSPARRALKKLRLTCGVLLCSRWGSAMVQWRGFPRGGV